MSAEQFRVFAPCNAAPDMVETMIGIVIGLLVILVIYSLLSAAENYRRMTTAASDAQITGLLSQFIMSRESAMAATAR